MTKNSCKSITDFSKSSKNRVDLLSNTNLDTTCYEPIADKLRENAKYWMEGVALVIVGAFGLLGNIFSMFVFRRTRGNKGFHSLLIT